MLSNVSLLTRGLGCILKTVFSRSKVLTPFICVFPYYDWYKWQYYAPKKPLRCVLMKTDEKQIEIEASKVSKAIEFSPATIVVTDIEGKIEYVNPSFARITGYSPEEVIGRNPSILQSGRTPESVYIEMWNTILAGRVWRGMFINKKANGEFYWEDAWIAPIKDESGEITHFVAIKEDITKQIQAENELTEAYKDLQIYSSLLHHDISNDLQIVLAQIEVLELLTEDFQELKESIETIKGASSRMSHLLQMLGSYKKKHEDNIEVVIRKQVLLAKATHRGIEVTINATPNIENVRVDGLALFPAVIDNLLRNSFQHAGSNLKITISLSISEDTLVIKYQDNGPGISSEVRDNLFERGISTRNGGLGLYLSRKIIEGYDGTIKLCECGNIHTGACFVIRLPATYIKKQHSEKEIQ
ncbi:MAG: putative Histidine kinase [Candidatus Thorarchaeota archaeon]|nr:MAG: putative Histidine kinase [Candidatus Thorarchaeota archaeon]